MTREKPQSLDERPLPPGGDTDRTRWKHQPTGPGTAPAGTEDVADPHPSVEEHYDRIPHPGGANPPDESRDIGPNPHRHTGTPPPRPDNAETEK